MPSKVVDADEIVLKAHVIGNDPVEKSHVQGVSQTGISPMIDGGAEFQYPHDPIELITLYQTTAHLRPPIDAMVTNIDGMGHMLVPVVDLSNEEKAKESVRTALELDRWFEMFDGPDDGDPGSTEPVSDELVNETLNVLRERQKREKLLFNRWIESAPMDGTFTDIRMRAREDKEVTGNAYLEFVRADPEDPLSPIIGIGQIRSLEMKIARNDTVVVETTKTIRRSALSVEEIPVRRTFPRYVRQLAYGARRWYKELGDPRVMSDQSGVSYESYEAMRAKEPTAEPAKEIAHHDIYNPKSPYGLPRWYGAMQAVLGSKAADEVNLDYFYAKPPAGMLLVSGGRLSKQNIDRLETLWNAKAKGKSKFHGLVVIEAATGTLTDALSAQATGKTTINFQPLSGTQQTDALFLKYDQANADKIGRMFRMPPLLRGDTDDQNRSTAEEARRLGEEQVFVPERNAFDAFMNTRLLPLLRITTWTFVSRGPQLANLSLADSTVKAMKDGGFLTIREARKVWARAIDVDLDEEPSKEAMNELESTE